MHSNSSVINSSSPYRTIARWAVLLLLMAVCSGCGTSSSTADGVTTYTIAAASHLIFGAIGVLLPGGGIVALLISLQKEGSKPLYEILAIVGGVIVLFGLVPGAMMSRVTVSDTRMSINCGSFWFGRDIVDFDLRNLNSIETDVRERWSRRGRRTETWYKFVLDNGTTYEIKSNGMLNEAVPQVGSMIESAAWNARQEAGSGAMMGDASGGTPGTDMAAGDAELEALSTQWPDLYTATAVVPGQPNFGGSLPETQGSGFSTPSGNSTAIGEGNAPADPDTPFGGLPHAASAGIGGLTVGTRVIVQVGAREFPGVVKEVLNERMCLVDVERDGRTISMGVPNTQLKISGSSDSQNAGGHSVRPSAGDRLQPGDVQAGAKLQALWGSSWYDVTIVAVRGRNLFRVNYDGYSENFDEDVPLERLRRRP